eukprot:88300-Chlamydomonas_euryale.AAC.1
MIVVLGELGGADEYGVGEFVWGRCGAAADGSGRLLSGTCCESAAVMLRPLPPLPCLRLSVTPCDRDGGTCAETGRRALMHPVC